VDLSEFPGHFITDAIRRRVYYPRSRHVAISAAHLALRAFCPLIKDEARFAVVKRLAGAVNPNRSR
jgi:hypothetical protein